MIRHKLGCTKTVGTAQAVLGYLSQVYPDLVFQCNHVDSGHWQYEILCSRHDGKQLDLEESTLLVRECRAFVCGRGELVS